MEKNRSVSSASIAAARGIASAQDAVDLAREKIAGGKCDLLILDEIHNALKLMLVDPEQLLGLLRGKPPLLHLVLTGHDAHPEVVETPTRSARCGRSSTPAARTSNPSRGWITETVPSLYRGTARSTCVFRLNR
jgi:ATP:corrinoid adenosyltransferase